MDLGRFGRGIRALRRRRGWRQQDLAEAARTSRAQVSRIERGESTAIPLGVVDRVAASVGGLVALLRAWGWDVAVEVSFSRSGEHGSSCWATPGRTGADSGATHR